MGRRAGAQFFRLSVTESLFRASEDALHKLKTFAGANVVPQVHSEFLTSKRCHLLTCLARPRLGGRRLTAPAGILSRANA